MVNHRPPVSRDGGGINVVGNEDVSGSVKSNESANANAMVRPTVEVTVGVDMDMVVMEVEDMAMAMDMAMVDPLLLE